MDTTPKSQKNVKFIRVLKTRYIAVMQTYKHDIPRNKARDSGFGYLLLIYPEALTRQL